MPSYRPYMSMKIDDLRHELASRNLPTEGLKQDLAFRLASLDDAGDRRPLKLASSTGASSETRNEKGAPVKTKNDHVSTSEARKRSVGQLSPSKIDSTPSSVHDHHHVEKERRRISRRARLSIAIHVAFLLILLVISLAYILWRYIPNVGQGYMSRSLQNGKEFVIAIFNDCQDFVRSRLLNDYRYVYVKLQDDYHSIYMRLQNDYHSIYMRIQRLSMALMKPVRNSNRPPPTVWWNGQ